MTDRDLLRQYIADRSEAAFARLMDQHMKLVYWTSRRDVQDPQLAEDVAQVVFLLLAQKAATLGNDVSISGWLFNTARLASRNALRREANRRRCEDQVAQMIEDAVKGEVHWHQIEPLLNDGLSTLAPADREAILLRFFGGLSFHELAKELGVSDEAARTRVSRAVGKLRHYLTKKEVTTTVVVLIALLGKYAASAVPSSCHSAALHGIKGFLTGAVSHASGQSQMALLNSEIGRFMAASGPGKLVLAVTAATVVGLTGAGPVLAPYPAIEGPVQAGLRNAPSAIPVKAARANAAVAAKSGAGYVKTAGAHIRPTLMAAVGRPHIAGSRFVKVYSLKSDPGSLVDRVALPVFQTFAEKDDKLAAVSMASNPPPAAAPKNGDANVAAAPRRNFVDDSRQSIGVVASNGIDAVIETAGKMEVVQPGDTVNGAKVVSIQEDGVTIKKENGDVINLPLAVMMSGKAANAGDPGERNGVTDGVVRPILGDVH